jgi:hypothetical protein
VQRCRPIGYLLRAVKAAAMAPLDVVYLARVQNGFVRIVAHYGFMATTDV